MVANTQETDPILAPISYRIKNLALREGKLSFSLLMTILLFLSSVSCAQGDASEQRSVDTATQTSGQLAEGTRTPEFATIEAFCSWFLAEETPDIDGITVTAVVEDSAIGIKTYVITVAMDGTKLPDGREVIVHKSEEKGGSPPPDGYTTLLSGFGVIILAVEENGETHLANWLAIGPSVGDR